MDIVIRPVRPADAPRLADIYNYYVLSTTVSFETSALTAAVMLERVQDVGTHWPYFVAEVDGRVEGFCYAHPWKDRPAYAHTLETTVYVDPARRGLGLGRRLMKRLVESCRAMGVHALVACITAENQASLDFHDGLGFSRVSLFPQVGRKFGRWLDVVDCQLLLDAGADAPAE